MQSLQPLSINVLFQLCEVSLTKSYRHQNQVTHCQSIKKMLTTKVKHVCLFSGAVTTWAAWQQTIRTDALIYIRPSFSPFPANRKAACEREGWSVRRWKVSSERSSHSRGRWMSSVRWSLWRKWKDRKKWGQQMSKKMRINPYKMEMKMNFQLNIGMKPVEKKIYIHTNFLRWSALIV